MIQWISGSAENRTRTYGLRIRCSALELQTRYRVVATRIERATHRLKAEYSTFELRHQLVDDRVTISVAYTCYFRTLSDIVVPYRIERSSRMTPRLQRESPSKVEPRDQKRKPNQKRKKPPRFPWAAFTNRVREKDRPVTWDSPLASYRAPAAWGTHTCAPLCYRHGERGFGLWIGRT